MIGFGARARVPASLFALIVSSASTAAAETQAGTGTTGGAPQAPNAGRSIAASHRECITIVPSAGPLSARFREELHLADDERVVRPTNASAPDEHAASPTAAQGEGEAAPCDRLITITDDEVTVADIRDGASVPLERAPRPLADATLLRLVEVARTRRGLSSAARPTSLTDARDGVPRATTAARASHLHDTVVALNPLALTFARLSIDVDRPLGVHHALHASVHAQLMPSNDLYDTAFFGGGGEIGYRYYTGSRGAEGLFVGPSLVGGIYATSGSLPQWTETFAAGGPSLDVGYATFLGSHAWLAVGIGAQYTWSTRDLDPDVASPPSSEGSIAANVSIPIRHGITSDATGPGIRPRLLVSLGWAF